MDDRLLRFLLVLTAGALPLLALRDRAVTPRGRLVFRLCLIIYLVVGIGGVVLLVREGG